jgi:3alpha(or 20beta)-hydroxysteroid dehydrogenase
MPSSKPVDLTRKIDYAALKGRNVLLTGGASGLGKAFVFMFADSGANIVIADIQDGPGKQLEQELTSKNVK